MGGTTTNTANRNTHLLNVRQTAERLGVHENTVRNWADSGYLKPAWTLPSGFRRFDPRTVERLRIKRLKLNTNHKESHNGSKRPQEV